MLKVTPVSQARRFLDTLLQVPLRCTCSYHNDRVLRTLIRETFIISVPLCRTCNYHSHRVLDGFITRSSAHFLLTQADFFIYSLVCLIHNSDCGAFGACRMQ